MRLHVQLCNLGNSEMCNSEELKIWVMKHSKIKMLRLMLIILLTLSAEVYSAKRAISGRPDSKLSGTAEGKTEPIWKVGGCFQFICEMLSGWIWQILVLGSATWWQIQSCPRAISVQLTCPAFHVTSLFPLSFPPCLCFCHSAHLKEGWCKNRTRNLCPLQRICCEFPNRWNCSQVWNRWPFRSCNNSQKLQLFEHLKNVPCLSH